MSAKIVPLFIQDEFTGLRVANRPSPEIFMVVNSGGKGVRCFSKRWQALNWINMQRNNLNLHIVTLPATGITVED